MYNKSNVRVDRVLESICVAAVQFPFIPVVIHHPETNWLSEPDGGINYGLVGGEMKTNFPRLSSIPISSMIPISIRFGGVPIGVKIPPILAP